MPFDRRWLISFIAVVLMTQDLQKITKTEVVGLQKLKWLIFHCFFFTIYLNGPNIRIQLAFTVFCPLLIGPLLYQRRIFDLCNQYLNSTSKNIYCVIFYMHPANEWMWTPDLGTLYSYWGPFIIPKGRFYEGSLFRIERKGLYPEGAFFQK